MTSRTARAVGLAIGPLLLTLANACSSADSAAPVATVAFTTNKTRIPLGSPIELTYRFDVAQGAKIDGDYKVFVHVVRDDGVAMWNDDHEPTIPTSQWKPGQTIQYTRTRFVPVVAFLGEAAVEIGLYRDQDRLPLQTSDPARTEGTNRAYRVGTLNLLPSSENVFIIVRNGWQQDFDRDAAIQLRVGGAIHLAHSAFADSAGDFEVTDAGSGGQSQSVGGLYRPRPTQELADVGVPTLANSHFGKRHP